MISSRLRKMNIVQILIVISFVFIFFLHSGVSIKCWICNSRTDPKCADPFVNDSIPLNDCKIDPKKPKSDELKDAVATMCRKVRQKVDNEWRVIRSCAYLGQPGEGTGNENVCEYTRESYNIFIESCTCNSKDGCNGASSLNKYIIFPSVITPFFLLLRKFFLYHL